MRFEFATATRIVFGAGTLREAGAIASALGRRALVVTGRRVDRASSLLSLMNASRVAATTFPVSGEPTMDDVVRGAQSAKMDQCDMVVGFGGGSAIDAGKAIAAFITNEGDILDYLEVIGQAKPLTNPPAPFIAIPTTAGTGAEATRNAVLASPEHRLKVSLRSPLLLAKVALVDPELTYDLPPELTASTGLDALTQLIEPYVSGKANPPADAVCVEGMRRAARALRRAFDNGADRAAREDMALASLYGGMALTNAGLGAVHGFAAPIGGMFSAPHGAVCAALLPHVMESNVRALRERASRSESLRRYDEVARLLTGDAMTAADDGIAWVRELCRRLQIQPLRRHGIKPDDFPALIEKAASASSMKTNPIPLTVQEMKEILERAW